MNQDFSELVKYLDGKFVRIDEKFVRIDEKFSRVDKRFDKTDQKLIGLEGSIKDVRLTMVTKNEFNDLQTSVDAYAKKADAYF